jgi:hypothetical protein
MKMKTQRISGGIDFVIDIEREVDDDGEEISSTTDSTMHVTANGHSTEDPFPDDAILLGIATGLAAWADEQGVSSEQVLNEIADAFDLNPSTAGNWTAVDERHYRGLHQHGAVASMAKGELVLWWRDDDDELVWFLTLAGEQIAYTTGGSIDDPPIEWANEAWEEHEVN